MSRNTFYNFCFVLLCIPPAYLINVLVEDIDEARDISSRVTIFFTLLILFFICWVIIHLMLRRRTRFTSYHLRINSANSTACLTRIYRDSHRELAQGFPNMVVRSVLICYENDSEDPGPGFYRIELSLRGILVTAPIANFSFDKSSADSKNEAAEKAHQEAAEWANALDVRVRSGSIYNLFKYGVDWLD